MQKLRREEGREEAALRAQTAGAGFVNVVLAFNTHVPPASALLSGLCDALTCPQLKCSLAQARARPGVLRVQSTTKGARYCRMSWAIDDKQNVYEAPSQLLAVWSPNMHSRSGQSCDIPTRTRTRVL